MKERKKWPCQAHRCFRAYAKIALYHLSTVSIDSEWTAKALIRLFGHADYSGLLILYKRKHISIGTSDMWAAWARNQCQNSLATPFNAKQNCSRRHSTFFYFSEKIRHDIKKIINQQNISSVAIVIKTVWTDSDVDEVVNSSKLFISLLKLLFNVERPWCCILCLCGSIQMIDSQIVSRSITHHLKDKNQDMCDIIHNENTPI